MKLQLEIGIKNNISKFQSDLIYSEKVIITWKSWVLVQLAPRKVQKLKFNNFKKVRKIEAENIYRIVIIYI